YKYKSPRLQQASLKGTTRLGVRLKYKKNTLVVMRGGQTERALEPISALCVVTLLYGGLAKKEPPADHYSSHISLIRAGLRDVYDTHTLNVFPLTTVTLFIPTPQAIKILSVVVRSGKVDSNSTECYGLRIRTLVYRAIVTVELISSYGLWTFRIQGPPILYIPETSAALNPAGVQGTQVKDNRSTREVIDAWDFLIIIDSKPRSLPRQNQSLTTVSQGNYDCKKDILDSVTVFFFLSHPPPPSEEHLEFSLSPRTLK
ncbi:unnamed protein product, partial [Timema podura]|nr:unnamed protein product [Timema podura]